MMDKLVCVSSLFVSLLYLHLTNGAILHVHKRSAEENTANVPERPLTVQNTDSQMTDDPHEGATRLRHILPIWWHYFRPLVQVTLQDGHFRRELEKQFEHEYDMFGASNDEQPGSVTRESGAMSNASPMEVGERTAMGSILESPNTFAIDDPSEFQESNVIHETSEMGGDTEQFIEATQTAVPFIEHDEALNEAAIVNGFAESESDGTTGTGELSVDDATVRQEFDNSRSVESTENPLAEFSNGLQANTMFADVDGLRSITDDTITSLSDSVSGFEQPSQDEVDSAATQDDLIAPNTNTAMWNNNAFETDSGSPHSEGIFDDRNTQGADNNGMFVNTDDVSTTSDSSELPVHTDDGRFSSSTWMLPAEGESNADSDFVPSFSPQIPFFSQAPLNLEPDSSS